MWISNQSVISPSLVPIGIFVGVERLAVIPSIEVVEQVACLADPRVELHRLLNRHGLKVTVLLPHVQLSRVIFHIEGQCADAYLFIVEDVDFI